MALAIRAWGVVKQAALFAVRRPKDAAIILLALLLTVLFWRIKHERMHAQELAAAIEGLPPNTKQVVTVYRDRVVTKWRDGPSKVQHVDRYLPPEGKVEIVTKEDEPQKPPKIIIKDRGLTARLGGGIVYAGKPLPMADLKWAYWRRYSLTLGVTPTFGGIGVSRHIDDISPFQNLEVVGFGGPDWHGSPQLGLGIRTNF